MKIYGNMQCPDCVRCCEDLNNAGVSFEFVDIFQSLQAMKEFLTLRDTHSAFSQIRSSGKIGIPCLVDEDKVTLEWDWYVTQA